MKRYIDADKLKADIKEVVDITDGKLTDFEVLGILSGQPIVDAVEVIRCKDCKYYRIWQMKCEKLHIKPFAENHYCSFGEGAEE